MNDYRIEQGVDIPVGKQKGKSKYPFADMDPGDSFYAPIKPVVVRSAATHWAKRNGGSYTVRIDGSGCRCWRVE